MRTTTLEGRLARMGFSDAPAAERLITSDLALNIGPPEPAGVQASFGGPPMDDALLEAIAAAADPDLALLGLARIAGTDRGSDAADIRAALRAEPGFRQRLTAVLGVSAGLADHLVRHPDDCHLLRGADAVRRPSPGQLRAALLYAVGASPLDDNPVADLASLDGTDPAAALCAAYKRHILHLAARDITGVASTEEVASELADIAAAVLCAALAVSRAELPAGAAPCRIAVLAMGKCGGCELNYASDVDVIFVAAPAGDGPGVPAGADPGAAHDVDAALRTATKLATGLIAVCSRTTPEGMIFPIDPNLRPEGRNGPLVRTLASHIAYYERWAKTWEFQALLKARPAAGDMELGRQYVDALTPMVWRAAQRERFVEDVQAMRRRVEKTLPAAQAGREIKLGPGGLRDIEFAVQLLQLVHGRTDEALRSPATLPALAALAAGGYVARDDASDLADAYRFLRQVEHLLQLYKLSRTHVLPEDPAVLRRLGRAMRTTGQPGQPGGPGGVSGPGGDGGSGADGGPGADPAAGFSDMWRQHAFQVRRLHEKLFYRPLLSAVARLPGEMARLTPSAARARLEALGYVDPAGALGHIDALTAGVSRRAAIQRTLLPVLLGWFADAAEPDAGLLAFRQVSDALGSTHWYLRLLRDETKAAERMAHVLASSRYAAGLLLRAPEAVAILGDDAELMPRSVTTLRGEAEAAVRLAQRAGERRRRGPFTAAARAAADRRRRHPRPDQAGRDRGRADRRGRRQHRRGPGRGGEEGGNRAGRTAAHAVRGDRHGAVRRSRDRLRQRRRRYVRARPAARRGRGGRRPRRARRGAGAAPDAGAAWPGPGAGGGREPAPRGPPGPAGPHLRLLPGLLPALVEALGGAGAAARRAGGRRPGSGG